MAEWANSMGIILTPIRDRRQVRHNFRWNARDFVSFRLNARSKLSIPIRDNFNRYFVRIAWCGSHHKGERLNLDEVYKYWQLAIVSVALICFLVDFVRRFVLPAWRLSKELNQSISSLTGIKGRRGSKVVELGEIAREAMTGATLSNPWVEYAKTLHPQREDDQSGQNRIVRWRATALAEAFFTEQAVVDTHLKTEYFKHLPGILTGIGIIGTFLGLISGLTQFDVSDPAQAQVQLSNLVKSVGHAFYVSATAIGMAMLFTLVEKWIIASRYREVEEIRRLIDSLFSVGAGEEYLERLVAASENAATQAAQIKDSLVADLREILTTLTSQQIEAQSLHTGQISGDVGKAISDSLGGPMRAISEAVKGVSSNQGDAVNRMLTDVLTSFSAQMKEMFGGQMEGMSDLLKQTSESMRTTAVQFGQLAANMDAAGTGTIDAMGERLNSALEAMEARQGIMNTQMGAFVEQIRSLVAESQSESSRKLQEVLGAVGQQVAGVVAELHRQVESSSESQGQRQERFERSTGEAIGSLSAQMESLLAQSVETNKALQGTVARLASGTDNAIAGMNSGAETLYVAASDFAKAGQGVSETMRASTVAVETIKTAAGHLSFATAGAKDIVADYGRMGDTFARMVSELKLTIEHARRDASMTSECIGQIEAATTELVKAQEESQDYLKGISEVLVTAHESFAQSVDRSLREGNRKFQGELSSAVELLSGAIRNLGDVLEEIPSKK